MVFLCRFIEGSGPNGDGNFKKSKGISSEMVGLLSIVSNLNQTGASGLMDLRMNT